MKKYPLYNVNYYKRYRDYIEGLAQQYKDKPAISWYTRKQEEHGVSYRQLRDDVRYLQEMMVQRGLAGKHIAIVGENSYEWLVTFFAATYCGAVAVCIDIEQPNETILQMLAMADVDTIFLSSAYLDICKQYTAEKLVLFSEIKTLIEQGSVIWKEDKENKTIDQQVMPEQTAMIVFTSGTTSTSKAVMLSQKAVMTNIFDEISYIKVGDTVFSSLPFYHTYGLNCSVVAVLLAGKHLYINGNMRTVMRDIQLAKPHTLFTVPLMIETLHNKIWINAEESGKTEELRKLLHLRKIIRAFGITRCCKKLETIRQTCVGTIRMIICGGAHMNVEIMEEFLYMGVTMLQGYGITECSPLVSVNRNCANKLGSVGLVIPHCEVKIEDGEILVRGDNIMTGYYKEPELTEEVLKDGWFCTGDIGYLDKDGYLYITGRKKNLIVFKNGKKVSPEKLEEKLKNIALVKDVVVYGVESSVSSDNVQLAASIYPNQEKIEGMTSYEILENLQMEVDKINNELPIYQQIKMINIREQEFIKTSIQKIKRHLI